MQQEYQQEQGEQRAKYQEMMKRRENANKLNTAQSVDEFKDMRVGTLKDILTENFVDHQHCLEKSELLDKVEALWREKQGAGIRPAHMPAICTHTLRRVCVYASCARMLYHMLSTHGCATALARQPWHARHWHRVGKPASCQPQMARQGLSHAPGLVLRPGV